MLYRIRYNTAGTSDESEVAIEANSPTEAIVKFRHTRSGRHGHNRQSQNVTSVCLDPHAAQTSGQADV